MISFLALSTLCCVVDELNKGRQNPVLFCFCFFLFVFFWLSFVRFPSNKEHNSHNSRQRNHTVKCIKYQGQNKDRGSCCYAKCQVLFVICRISSLLTSAGRNLIVIYRDLHNYWFFFFLYVLTGSRIKGGVAKKQQNLHISVNPQNSSLNKQQTFNVCSMVFICTLFFFQQQHQMELHKGN